MIGNSSVKIDYFIYRAICSNGLVAEVFNNKNRIIHSGKKENFIKRLNEVLNPIMKEMIQMPKLLKELVEIDYKPITLANIDGAEKIYKIIPLDDLEYKKRQDLKKKEDRIKFDEEKMKKYVNMYSGEHSKAVFASSFRVNQSIFDFINIFTEYAHSPNIKSNKQRKQVNLWVDIEK